MVAHQNPPPLTSEQIEQKKREHRKYVERFEQQFGDIDTKRLATQMDREGFSEDSILAKLKDRLSISAVIDACCVLDLIFGIVKGKPSPFWEMVKTGLITCWAPVQLEDDLAGKFEALATKLGVRLERVEMAWYYDVAPHIRVACGHETPEVTAAIHKLAARDPKDVEYPGLMLTLGADVILTRDRHMRDDDQFTTMTFGDAIRMVKTHDRGRVALQVQFQTAEALMVFMHIGTGAAKEVASGMLKLLKRIPVEVWVGLGTGLGAIASILMLFEKPRNWFLRQIAAAKAQLGKYWDSFSSAAIKVFEFLAPIVQDLMRASNDAMEQAKASPKREKQFGRIPTTLRDRIVACLRNQGTPMALPEIMERAFPLISSCDVSVLRRQVYRLMRKDPNIVRSSRGRYTALPVMPMATGLKG